MTDTNVVSIVVSIVVAVATIFTALATLVMALFTLLVAFATYLAARASAKAAEAAERSSNLAGLRELLLSEYLEREFKATEAPIINDKEVTRLRAAKTEALNQYRNQYGQNWLKEWGEVSDLSHLGWQNKVAFETAWVLEHLGALTFTGILPLSTVLSIAGDTIIDDWLLCRSWVESYQKSEEHNIPPKETPGGNIHFHRRHAEWLVLVAVEWMNKCWPDSTNWKKVTEKFEGKQNIPTRIQSLSREDGELMPQAVKKEIKRLIGIEVK